MPGGSHRNSLRQVFRSPMRVRILELLTNDAVRPVEAAPLTEALTESFPDATPKQVSYHLAILEEANLIHTD